ncbi:MAG: transaldolase [bacterium]|nr:transaldolase [bacterium]
MKRLEELRVKIFADGAEKEGMLELARLPYVKGFTTNPTLMRKAGVANYAMFAQEIVAAIPDRPLSFEVLADEFEEMERQARLISGWGSNVYVKIPITNTRGESSCPLIARLTAAGLKLNVTALLTLEQVHAACEALRGTSGAFVSVFAGRIADTGVDPVPVMAQAVSIVNRLPCVELLWASSRELLNIFQAEVIGCHIITVTHDILRKLTLVGKDLTAYSLETVQQFYHDACAAGYAL